MFILQEKPVTCGCLYLRMGTNESNMNAGRLYKKLGYKEVFIVPSFFNGIKGVNLVCLEKKLLKKAF